MTVADPAGTRRPRVDLLTVLWLLVGYGICALHGFDGAITRDSAFYVYAGQRVAEGAAPYVELMNRAGPLAHLLPGAGVLLARVTGMEDVYGVRLVFFLVSAAAPAATYALARSAFASRMAGSAAAAAMLCYTGYAVFTTTGPQSKSPIVTLLVWALLLVVQRRWIAAGVVTGLATLTWQPVMFAAAPGALVGCLLVDGRGGKARALVRYVVGGLGTLLAMVVYFALKRALEMFWFGFVLANVKYTEQPGADDSLSESLALFREGFGWTTWVWLVGCALLAGAVALALVPRQRDEAARHVRTSTLVILGGFVGGALWTYKVYNGWADAFMLLPFGALGFGALVGALAPAPTEGAPRRTPHTLVLAAVVAVWALVLGALTAQDMVRTKDHGLRAQISASKALFRAIPEGYRTLSLHGPIPLALTNHQSVSTLQLFSSGMDQYVEDTWPGGLQGYIGWAVETQPEVITTSGGPEVIWAQLRGYYENVGQMEGTYVMVRRTVDPAVKDRIRTALAQAQGRNLDR